MYLCSRNKCLNNILVTQTAVSCGFGEAFIIEQPTAELLKHSYVLWFMSIDIVAHLSCISLSN